MSSEYFDAIIGRGESISDESTRQRIFHETYVKIMNLPEKEKEKLVKRLQSMGKLPKTENWRDAVERPDKLHWVYSVVGHVLREQGYNWYMGSS